jgi:hypothetical protein|uniref:Uncharacterized protein n=1 Tax=viral metagenome TaxID=1070528 RepID=A0A6C0DGD4_9ZZZZ
MVSIFSNLPNDIKKHILSFDKHFKIRKGQLISIIPKDDIRFSMLQYTTFQLLTLHEKNANEINFRYNSPNLYNISNRGSENDMVIVLMKISCSVIKYDIFIGHLKPKINDNRIELHSIDDCGWNFFNYCYERA